MDPVGEAIDRTGQASKDGKRPEQKPERLLERIVLAASRPDSRVLDPMCGSGTTLVAAARHGRRWAGIDVSPLACKVASQRLERLSRTSASGQIEKRIE